MGLWHAEHRHDRVADELLHATAVTLHGRTHRLEVALQERPEDLRIMPLGERG